MSIATPNNAPPSARTSSNGPPADTTLSEEQFLEREADRTRAALNDALADLKESLRTAADVRLWTVQHPWAAVGAAAAAGFAAAAAFQGAVQSASEPAANGAAAPSDGAAPRGASAGPARASAITSGMFELAKVALQSTILAAGNAAAARADHDQPPTPPDLPT